MQIKLENIKGEHVCIKASDTFCLKLIADERELLSVDDKGQVLVNGESTTTELVGLAFVQWANKAAQVLGEKGGCDGNS